MKDNISTETTAHRYNLIDMKDVDQELVPEEMLRGKYIRQVDVLSQLRDLQDEVCKEAEAMALVYDLERDVRFKQGRERGMVEGEQRGERRGVIEGMLELKYGSAGLELMNMVRIIPTVDKLEEFKNLIRKAGSVDELKEFFGRSV